jgi:hypothetical protein
MGINPAQASDVMTVYIVIPDNDRQKRTSRITVRTSEIPGRWLTGPERDCSMIRADLDIKAARVIAQWVAEYDSPEAYAARYLAERRDADCGGLVPAPGTDEV